MPNNNQPEREGNKSRRGFASMDEEKKREIASKGGKAAHASGNAHEFTSEEAREAGRKGGQAKGSRSNSQRGGMTEDRSQEGSRENI